MGSRALQVHQFIFFFYFFYFFFYFSFFYFYWNYLIILLLFVLYLFCCILKPICIFIEFNCSHFFFYFHIFIYFPPYQVLNFLHVTFHQISDRTLTGEIGTICFVDIALLCSYIALE